MARLTLFFFCLSLLAQTPPIKVSVDAGEASRRLLRTAMDFPVTGGPFSLSYPKWIPGEHGPTGPIEDLVGIHLTGNGQAVPWNRDTTNLFEFHLIVTPGVSTIHVGTQFISPPDSGAFSAGGSITSEGGAIHHYLHLAADSERATRISDEETQHYRNLVKETTSLFGASHYRNYHFLYAVSDHLAHFGLEHHESSDDRTDEEALIDDDHRLLAAGLRPHEFVHSWNGKFRRPAGLATPLTEYLGEILTPRSGLSTTQDFFDSLGGEAAGVDREAGRTRRPLEDTPVAAQILYTSRSDYRDLRRPVNYYEEGTLIWLDADVMIRTLSCGRKSLDDFCRLWAEPPASAPEVKPYTFNDIVKTLNAIQPYNWAAFLNERLQSTTANAPLNEILNGGYNLVYTSERTGCQKNGQDLLLNSPAYAASLSPSAKIIAVNGREFSPSGLRNAVADAVKSTAPILLISDIIGPHTSAE